MGQLHIHEFISLDGVIDAPTWTFEYGFDPRMGERLAAVTNASDGILLGRRTYQMFEGPWSSRTVEEDPGAPFFNDTTKYVVTGTLTETTWRNSTIVGRYDPATIAQLKARVDGDLYTSGSGTLVRAMLADGLVDQLHLCVYPLTRGSGPRLFGDGTAPSSWRTVVAESYDNGVLYLNLHLA
jgi:dihydrofolate reductase